MFLLFNFQEPAFQELILFYTDEGQSREMDDEALPLQLKIYERIPIPDLPVTFSDNIYLFTYLYALVSFFSSITCSKIYKNIIGRFPSQEVIISDS